MPTSRTPSSTPRLSEVARHVIYPKDIATTGWPAVEAKCAEMGVVFDGWQQGLGRLVLGKRKDGKYAATTGGIVLSIPRQVGKTFFVGMILIALCVLFPGLTVLWTAHRTRTATKTFQTMQGMVRRRKIRPHLAPGRSEGIRSTNGEQEIRFRNGSVIMFGAREQGFGRGFDQVDIEVFDEAQILTAKALEDMVPAANQSTHPAGALLFFMGTPPRPSDPGEEFTARRSKALSGRWSSGVYVEMSADPDASPDDPDQWAKANPSFPRRTPRESMERMREQLTDDESFCREALGIWDELYADSVINLDEWGLVADEQSTAVDRLVLGLHVNQRRTRASVSLAGLRADGVAHFELDQQEAGTAWVVPWVLDRWLQNPQICAVVVDDRSQASSFITKLKAEGVRVVTTDALEMAAACGAIYDAVTQRTVRHIGQPQLRESLVQSSTRPMLGGKAWGWNPRKATSDETPIVSATLALWGVRNPRVKTRRPSGSDGSVLVLE